MGAKESKLSCISYEDAIVRVNESEFKRIKDAFKKSTRPVQYLNKQVFQNEVCDGFPEEISELLYNACGGYKSSNKGINFKDLFCALVLLSRGTKEEKIRFLWNLYCNDNGTYILKQDYVKYLNLESKDIRSLNTNSNLIYSSLFAQSDKVNFEQFNEWIISHKSSTLISQWLLSDAPINLTSELETPTFYQSLAGVTHLEEQEICDLEKEFWRLKNNSKNGQLDLELLGPLLSPPIPKAALSGLFHAFDENRDGHIDFKELCCGVSASCRGPNVERCKFCFKIFDLDGDGTLNSNELNQMIEILLFVAKESKNLNKFQTITKNYILNDLIRFTKNNSNSEVMERQEFAVNLTQEDFMMWNIETNLSLVQPFLDLIFEVCHIIFGLRPECKHMEFEIVKGWLTREERRGYKIGQFWYLISQDWWNCWMQYTQMISSHCSYNCKISTNIQGRNSMISPTGIDEAIVCDENLCETSGELLTSTETSSLGSTSSGLSFGAPKYMLPGHIDNTNLVVPNLFKNIKTLTGEGGHLKKDTPLVQRHDFELVPKALWEALARWYGYITPLPRQVIKPPNGTVELELYPLNLRILLHQILIPSSINSANPSWNAVAGGYGALTSALIAPSVQMPKRYLAYTGAFSRLATIKLIGEFLCENLKLKYENIRLWHIPNGNSSDDCPILLEEENMTLKDYCIRDNDQILLERRNNDLTWPEELGSLSHQSSAQDRHLTRPSIHSVHVLGATGLHNLGNTCFMNSALQVLFNTQTLTQYFIRNVHLFELNPTNKLSTTKGQLAIRYGELLREIWTTNTRSIAPLKLRFCITKYAPQFAGGGQHDSQELLEWLLDGLNEDLNRVTEKPYVELKDSNGRPDETVSVEAWTAFQARNQSIITDLFYGQLKSKVSCQSCGAESVRFDPFSLLSLPLPVDNYIYFEILVILLDGSMPIKYGLKLNSDSTYYDVKKKLSEISESQLHPNLLLLCQLSNYQIKTILLNDQKIIKNPNINNTELYAYELPESDESRSRTSSILGVNIEKGLKDIQRSSNLIINTDLTSNHQIYEEYPNHKSFESLTNSKNFDMTNNMNDLKQSSSKTPEMSRSPESTFVINPKQVLTTNLLPTNVINNNCSELSCNCSASEDRNNFDNIIIHEEKCPCRNNASIEIDETNSDNSGEFDMKLKKQLNNSNINRVGKYLIAIHRKLARQDVYFLSYNKMRSSLFGVPLLLPCYEGITNKDLYCSVWLQVSRLLSPLPAAERGNHATDCDDSLGYDFPFTLRAVTYDGKTCALCPWTNFCRGCDIPCNDDFVLEGALKSCNNSESSKCSTPKLQPKISSSNTSQTSSLPQNIHIAIDWDPTALHLRYSTSREKLWKDHESVFKCRRKQNAPIDLNQCLEAFTSEEKLEQWYNCSHCYGKRPATKKLQIWKLPPILIIHLKRFNCINNKWVKSNVHVNFPFEQFDPTGFLASIPQETILRYKDLNHNNNNYNKHNILKEIHNENDDIKNEINNYNQYDQFNEQNLNNIKLGNVDEINVNEINDTIEDTYSIKTELPNFKNLSNRKRLISTSLTKSPVVDGNFKDFHQHKLKNDSDKFDLKYKLYAVVAHSGMLSGGHYVSYASNPNGHWYCYNDSSCREILNKPNIDPSSAYLLFYERENLDYEPYIPNCAGRLPEQNFEFDDSDNDLKKMCAIS